MKAKEFDIKKRNPNWRTMQDIRRSGAGGQHKDKKRAAKQGEVKHKSQVAESEHLELYGLRIGDTVTAKIDGGRVQGDIIDIYPEDMEVELFLRGPETGRTVVVDVRDTEIVEATGDEKFDTMMRRIKKDTKKQATADRRERDTESRRRSRDAFGPSPADKLSIRPDKDVEEGLTTEKQILTRIRQIMNDRKLSGTESNAGELHRLKRQLKDLRSQQSVAEGDEPDEQYLDKVISDLHKDAFGMRPGREFGQEWMSSSYEEKLRIYNNMLKNLHSDIDEGIGGTIAGGVGQFIGNKIDPLAGEIMRAHGEIAGRKAEYTIRKYMHLLQKELKQQLDSGKKEEGVAEAIDIGQEWMTDTELDQYVPDQLQQQWRELVGYDAEGNVSALWANITGGYEPDANDPEDRANMVRVANKWFAMKRIPNVRFSDVRDVGDELEWLVQIGSQGVEEASDWGEPREILEDVLQTLEREVEWPLTEVMDPKEVRQLLSPIVRAVNDKLLSMDRDGNQ